MTIEATLCFIVRKNEVLLLKKSVGLFGQGKWNAPGGKILPGKTAQECAIREVLEETQLTIKALHQIAIVYFYKYDKRKDPDWKVNVFVSHDFAGTASDGREGIVKWFSVDALPFHEMWEDDRHWSRLVFEGKRFEVGSTTPATSRNLLTIGSKTCPSRNSVSEMFDQALRPDLERVFL